MVQAARQQRAGSDEKCSQAARRRLLSLLRRELSFIISPSFKRIDHELEREVLEGNVVAEEVAAAVPKNLPGHLARLCEAKMLSADEERELFRRMNYLKYRANVLRASLDPECPDMIRLEQAERFIAAAQLARDRLIKANMRLAISVVKRFVTARHTFDDLLSEGIVSLMHAVNKFDYDRGFRFSTYAYRAIARNTYRTITSHQKEVVRFSSDMGEALADSLIDGSSADTDMRNWSRLRQSLTQLLRRLDRREQLIVRCRYALGAHRKVQTFQAIAEKLGVSKERVRQLEQRAMGKLRTMACDLDLEESVDA